MVVTHPHTGHQLNIGLDVVAVPRLQKALELAEGSGCDFVLAPLAHPRYERVGVRSDLIEVPENLQRDSPPSIIRDEPLTRSDMELSCGVWMAGVVAKLSPWISPDSPNAALRTASEAAFAEEVSFAAHMSLRALVVPPPNGGSHGVANLARCIRSALEAAPLLQIWLRLTVLDLPAKVPLDGDAARLRGRHMDPWHVWNTVRTLCGEHPNLGVALELTPDLPARLVLDKWLAEPVRVVLLSTSSYVTNKVGYPVLSRRHQDFIKMMFTMRPFFALTGRAHKVKGGEGYRPFVQYLAHLFGKMPGVTDAESFQAPYHDYLQSPLQPLAHNLGSQTYETFEKDPVKYAQYQAAIAERLSERKWNTPPVIMVLGAGRGPLVKCSLNAAKTAGVEVTVFAVEKNPNAIVTLRNLKAQSGWTNVTVIAGDMRGVKLSEKADIIVSELLGSFGDNELSPECLDGAQHLLKEDGVSIPQSYTSYLAPLASTKLHNEVKSYGDGHKDMETAYVVKIHRGKTLSKTEPCFRFEHPNRDPVIDNSRYARMTFVPSETNMIHGLAGYFEAVLYKDIHISINPPTFSTGMFSWFPIYFPITNPIYVESGQNVTVHMWRRTNSSKVWYEWCITEPSVTPIHNSNGRSFAFGLK